MKIRLLTVFAFFSFVFSGFSQYGAESMLNSNVVFQRLSVNPAYVPTSKFIIQLPLIGGISAGYTIPVVLEKILYKQNDTTHLSLNSVVENFGKNNLTQFTNSENWLALGYNSLIGFFSFQMSTKIDAAMHIDKDLLTFLKEGNAGKLGQRVVTKSMDINTAAYGEMAIGYSKKLLNNKLTIGGRIKLLSGAVNIQNDSGRIEFYTSKTGDRLNIISKQAVNYSGPVDFKVNSKGNVDFRKTSLQDVTFSDFLGFKNSGVGFDFGVDYKLNDKFSVWASVLDMGVIHWRNFTGRLTEDINFDMEGDDFSEQMGGNSNGNRNSLQELADSIGQSFKISNLNSPYSTSLNTKLRIGATYDVTKQFSVLSSFGGVKIFSHYYPFFTLAGSYSPTDFLHLNMNYSVIHGNAQNIGTSFVIGKAVQFYVATENLFGFNYTANAVGSISTGLAINL